MEGPDQGVLQVFVLGWRIAQLHRYATVPPRPAARPDSDRGLPGLRDLDDRAQRIRLGIAEVAATLHRLSDRLAEAGLALPDTRALLQAADAGQEITPQLQRLNLILVVQLNAAEYRLQTGFALGRELYDTTRTVDNQDDLKRVLKHHRLLGLRESLQALQSAFPPHAARAVSLSLGQWRQWAQEDAPADFVRVRDLLRRQGDLWHSLLSGERSGTDLLDAEDYLSAAEQMFRSARGVSGRFCRQFSAPIVFIVLLVAGSLGLAIGIGSGAVTLAALGAVATALGVSWSGLRDARHDRRAFERSALGSVARSCYCGCDRHVG